MVPSGIPFTIRVRSLVARCRAERPLVFNPRPGATPVSALRGTIGWVLEEVPELHGLRDRFKVSSDIYPNQLPPAMRLRVASGERDDVFTLRLDLWGSRAASLHREAAEAVHLAGLRGVRDARGPARFDADVTQHFDGTLADHLAPLLPPAGAAPPTRALVELTTPCDTPDPTVPGLAGNVASALTKLCLDEDVALARSLGRRGCQDRDEAARQEALRAFGGVSPEATILFDGGVGERPSGRTGKRFIVGGIAGYVVLTGALGPCLPWLHTLALWGAGGRRSFGQGEVRVWLPAGDTTP